MHSKLDFSALTLKDALDLAILMEVEAGERYEELAEQLETHNTTEAADFFTAMVNEEAKHARSLSAQREALFGTAPVQVDADDVPGIETPDYDDARAFMTPQQALQVALKCEERARDFYANAIKEVRDTSVKGLFTQLHAEELSHVEHVLRIMKAVGSYDGNNPEDFVDEPVAQ